MKAWEIITTLLIILALALTTACSATGNQQLRQYQQVQVVRGDLIVRIHSNGKIETPREVSLNFGNDAGRIDKLLVREGDSVKKGDVLAQLDTSSLELSLAQAQASLSRAQLAQEAATNNLETVKDSEDTLNMMVLNAEVGVVKAQKIVDSTHVDADTVNQDYQTAMNQLAAAQLSLSQAQKNLEDLQDSIALQESQVSSANQTVVLSQQSVALAQDLLDQATIIAPFDGVITGLSMKEGDMIPSPAGNPRVVMYLVDTNNMEVNLNLSEMDIPSVQVNQNAIISVDALPGIELEGNVTSVFAIPNIQAGTGAVSYEVKVGFAVPVAAAIKPGMSAAVDITTGEGKNVLLLPSRAIKQDSSGRDYVMLANGQTMVNQPIVTGLSNGNQTEIVSGLGEGDKVVTEITAGRWSLQ